VLERLFLISQGEKTEEKRRQDDKTTLRQDRGREKNAETRKRDNRKRARQDKTKTGS
jgi:hypothetical protein